jgi:hypothetical protein
MHRDHSLLPLVIGTSGHRDPLDPALVLEQVKGIMREINDIAPEVPLCVMSPLASGCDRIVARAALWIRDERRRRGRYQGSRDGGVELMGVLPLEADDYRLDFEEGACRAEFEELLALCDSTVVLPIHDGARTEDVVRDGRTIRAVDGGRFERDRNEGFERLGRFTAIHSHILIAMWNGWNTQVVGADKTGIGGTSAVVHFCRGGNAGDKGGGVPMHEAISPILESPSTPVAFVHTMRVSDARKRCADLSAHLQRQVGLTSDSVLRERVFAGLRWDGVPEQTEVAASRDFAGFVRSSDRSPGSDPWHDFKDVVASLRRLNAGEATGDGELREDLGSLASEDKGLQRMVATFERIDALAVEDRKRFERAGRLGLGLLVLAILLFQFFSSWSHWYFIAPYLLVLVISRRPKAIAKRLEPQRAESRALAELLRVQVAWRTAGLKALVSDHIDERRVQQLGSMRQLLRSALIPAVLPMPIDPAPICVERRSLVVKTFLRPQAHWRGPTGMKSKKRHAQRVQRCLAWARRATVLVALLALLACFVVDFELLGFAAWPTLLKDHMLPALNLFVGVTLLSVFAIDSAQSIHGTRGELLSADAMRPLFEAASLQVVNTESPHAVAHVLIRIGDSVVDEQLDWYIERRDGAELDSLG